MALLPGSPAIDAGSNALAIDAIGNPLTDQRGLARIVGTAVDIGAFESQGFTLTPVAGSTPQGTGFNSPFANPLALIVTANNPVEPVAGGVVTFSAPSSGASASLSTTSPVTIGSNGQASVTATANITGGQYTVSASTAGAAAPASFVLTNLFPTVSQTINFGPLASQTYGVAPITLSATASSGLPVTFSVIAGPATLSGSVLTVTGAGTVEVAASQPGNTTYLAAVPVDESFTVNPASLIVTATNESMTYGGTMPALTYTYSGLVNGDSSATFSGSLVTTASSSSSVGGYPITQGTLAATGNYTIGTFNLGTLTVNAAPLTVTATAKSMTYGGTVPALTYTYTGLVNGDTSATFIGGLLTTATSSSNVGGYPITQGTLAATGNYTIGTFDAGTLTVTTASLSLTVTATAKSMIYGGTVPALTYTYTGLVNGNTSATFTGGLATTATSSSGVGGYPITQGTLAATGNYTIGTFNAGTLTVNPAPLIVTAANVSETYGTVPPLTYTYTGLVNGDESATFIGGLATTATSSSDAGNYPITQGTLAATGNYTIGTFHQGTETLVPAQLIVVAANESMTYGGTIPALTYTYTGLVNGDQSATFIGGLATTASSSSGLSVYPITQGTLAATGNYTIATFYPGSLTVTPAQLIVTAANESMTYGGTVPALTYTYSGLVKGDKSASFSGRLASTGTSSSGVGGYEILQGTLAATGNYTIATFNPGILTVTPAPLIVTAANESMTYGGTVPALTYTYTGLVEGDEQRHVQRRSEDHSQLVERLGRLPDQSGDSGCDRQLHDRHVPPGHPDGDPGAVDRDRCQ